MKPYHFDLHRMFVGDLPLLFLAEIAFRTAFIYLYTLFLVRVLGKRGMGQLSPFDFVIVIALGSAVGDPMFYEEVPLLHSMAVITVVVALQRFFSWLTERSRTAERFLESAPRRLVRLGVLDCENLHEEEIECDELFAFFRTQGLRHLGQVERAYIEPSGHISVLKRTEPSSGLPLIPPEDPDYHAGYAAGEAAPASAHYCCTNCGCGLDRDAGTLFPARCGRCPGSRWLRSVSD